MRTYKIKWGRFIIIRWIVVSWFLQAIHVLDKTEMAFRLVSELVFLIPLFALFYFNFIPVEVLLLLGFVVHTFFFLSNSTWLVGLREFWPKYKGSEIDIIIKFCQFVEKDTNELDVGAILIYGSLCRKKFHKKSDLDLRIVVGETDKFRLFLKAVKFRFYSVFKFFIPLDLKVVDSTNFLENEMSGDEIPIVIRLDPRCRLRRAGDDFSKLKESPISYLK